MEQENTIAVKETAKPTFDDFLKDGTNQSEFDKRVGKALETAKAKWEEEYKAKLEAEKTEAQKLAKMDTEQKHKYELEIERKAKEEAIAKLNAYELKEQAEKIAYEKGLPRGYLSLIDFKTANADNLATTIESLVSIRSSDLEGYIKDKVKETPPKSVAGASVEIKEIPHIF